MAELRVVDDKIVLCLRQMDRLLNHCLSILSKYHPHYTADALISNIYDEITPGGVRIFKGSRKKENIKLKLIDLIAHVGEPTFSDRLESLTMVRFAREKIVSEFLRTANENYKAWAKFGDDPFRYYTKIRILYNLYLTMGEAVDELTFDTLSSMVLKKYVNWGTQRSIKSVADRIAFEEDKQNSLFSIKKARQLFIVGSHKSYFSYVTRWIKSSITESDFKLKKPLGDDKKPIQNIDIDKVPLAYEEHTANTESNVVTDFLEGTLPLPNELRVFYNIMKNC